MQSCDAVNPLRCEWPRSIYLDQESQQPKDIPIAQQPGEPQLDLYLHQVEVPRQLR